jgi:tubulin-specific chaperone D
VVDVSSDLYFVTLLEFLQVPWLQSWILQGIIHSIATGTEDLMRLSRLALINTMFNNTRGDRVGGILETLVSLLDDSYTDDRQAVPLLETIAFIMEQAIDPEGELRQKLPTRRLWNIVRKAHFKSTNIRKLEAAVRIYGALALEGEVRRNSLGKLRDLLLHPYPSVSTYHLSCVARSIFFSRVCLLTVLHADPKRSSRCTVYGITR